MAENASLELLSSLNSTADRTSSLIANKHYTSGQFAVNITARASTDAGPVVTVQGLVPGTTGTFYTVLASTAIGTSSTSDAVTELMHVGPGWSTLANKRAATILPSQFRVISTYSSTTDTTYSVGVHLS